LFYVPNSGANETGRNLMESNQTEIPADDDITIDGAVLKAIRQIEDATQTLLLEFEDEQLSPEVKIATCHSLTNSMKNLRYINGAIQKAVGKKMKSDGNKMAVVALPTGVQVSVEQVNKSTRKDVDREALLMAVNKIAGENKHRVNTVTGELCDIHESRNRLYNKCFRMEPRWTELKAIGIDDDEFCIKSWDTSVKVTQGGSL
jgi:hypothetical protein